MWWLTKDGELAVNFDNVNLCHVDKFIDSPYRVVAEFAKDDVLLEEFDDEESAKKYLNRIYDLQYAEIKPRQMFFKYGEGEGFVNSSTTNTIYVEENKLWADTPNGGFMIQEELDDELARSCLKLLLNRLNGLC